MEIVQRFSFSTVRGLVLVKREEKAQLGIKWTLWPRLETRKVFLNDDLDFFQKMIGLWFVSR